MSNPSCPNCGERMDYADRGGETTWCPNCGTLSDEHGSKESMSVPRLAETPYAPVKARGTQ